MGYCFEAGKAYDKKGNGYSLTGMDLNELRFLNVSLHYRGITEEAGRCLKVLETGEKYSDGDREIELLMENTLEETITADEPEIKVSPFVSSAVLKSGRVTNLYIGYCHHLTIRKDIEDNVPIRIHFRSYDWVHSMINNAIISLKDAVRHMRSCGRLNMKSAVILEYEDGEAMSLTGIKDRIIVQGITTYRETVDLKQLCRYADMLGTKCIYADTEDMHNLESYYGYGSELKMFIYGTRDSIKLYNFFTSVLEPVEELAMTETGAFPDLCYTVFGYSYEGIGYRSTVCYMSDMKCARTYMYHDIHFLLVSDGRTANICKEVQ